MLKIQNYFKFRILDLSQISNFKFLKISKTLDIYSATCYTINTYTYLTKQLITYLCPEDARFAIANQK